MALGVLTKSKPVHPIRVYREAAGYSQQALGQRSGITLIRISKIEQGKSIPTEAEIQVLSKILNAPAASLRLRIKS